MIASVAAARRGGARILWLRAAAATVAILIPDGGLAQTSAAPISRRPWIGVSLGYAGLISSINPVGGLDAALWIDMPLARRATVRVGTGRSFLGAQDDRIAMSIRRLTLDFALARRITPSYGCDHVLYTAAGVGLYGMTSDAEPRWLRRAGIQLAVGYHCTMNRYSLLGELGGRLIRPPAPAPLGTAGMLPIEFRVGVRRRF